MSESSVVQNYHSLFGVFWLQEAMKKKLEIQKQKQELLNKQIKEQKVCNMLKTIIAFPVLMPGVLLPLNNLKL